MLKIEEVPAAVRKEIKAVYEGTTVANPGNGLSFKDISENYDIERVSVTAIAKADGWNVRKSGIRLRDGIFISPTNRTVAVERALKEKPRKIRGSTKAATPKIEKAEKPASIKTGGQVFVIPADMPEDLRKRIAIACIESNYPIHF